jgi:hypothetical protein
MREDIWTTTLHLLMTGMRWAKASIWIYLQAY